MKDGLKLFGVVFLMTFGGLTAFGMVADAVAGKTDQREVEAEGAVTDFCDIEPAMTKLVYRKDGTVEAIPVVKCVEREPAYSQR